ncbi:MAG: hypothetical protein N2746_08155 [Deltaproteobacteria bacterium]|nr:hypothetical protein [Deltaproteobacteria bacterium]
MRVKFLVCFSILVVPQILSSEEKLRFSGDIRSNLYVGLIYGDIYNYFNSNMVTLKGEAKPNDSISGGFEIRLRNENIADLDRLDELKYRRYVEPVSWQFYEAFMQFNAIFMKELDIKVGKQRISWGTADGFNPTDNFSPLDLEDPLDFKNKLSVWALSANFYYSRFDLQLVLQPLFEPALLPNINLFATESNVVVDQYKDRVLEPELILPEFRIKNSIYGARLKYKGEIFDVSASYFHGYLGIPVLREVKIETGGFALKSITPVLFYPTQDVLGLDMAVDIFDIGIFGEMAYIIPERVEPLYYVNGHKLDEQSKRAFGINKNILSVEDKHYLKFAVGLDYTFKGGYYINVQFVRGFFNEVSYSSLNNYLFAYLKKDFFDSTFNIQPSFGIEFDSDSDEKFGGEEIRGEKAIILSLEATYFPFSNGKITIGGAVARGDRGSNLEMFEKLDQMYLKFRMDF